MSGKPPKYDMKIIKPECVELNIPYAITVNPCDDHQYFKLDTSSRIESCKIFMIHCIDNMAATPIILYPEVSSKGRIHWHGLIKFKTYPDVLKFFITHVPGLLSKASIEIDTISDPHVWDEYCTKQKSLFDWSIQNYSLKKNTQKLKINNIIDTIS